MSKFFVVNGYQSEHDFWIEQEDFDALHELLGEFFDEARRVTEGEKLMLTDITHMELTNLVKKIAAPSKAVEKGGDLSG